MDKLSVKRTISYCLVGMFMVACTTTGEEDVGAQPPKLERKADMGHRVCMERAKQNVLDFIGFTNNGTRAASKHGVADVQPIVWTQTRSGVGNQEDTLLYVVNTEDSAGFAIATADDRLPPILALVDKGNYTFNPNDTANSGFFFFMEAALDYCKQQTERPQTRKTAPIYRPIDPDDPEYPSPPRSFEVMKPLLNCKWGQHAPYNMYCSKYPTGCVVTASAQIMSFLENPKQMEGLFGRSGYRVTDIDWKLINEEAKHFSYPNSQETQRQVAAMMRHLGVNFNAKYDQSGTSVNTDDAIGFMRKEYGLDVSDLRDYDCGSIINDLRCGNKIVIMSGKSGYHHVLFFVRKYTGGHAWVVDGYIDYVTGWRSEEHLYLHCNWGWNGNCNGYFLDGVFNTDTSPSYEDNVSSTRSHYRYQLKYATFTKH